jgi:hypothetical protein
LLSLLLDHEFSLLGRSIPLAALVINATLSINPDFTVVVASLAEFFALLVTALVASSAWNARKGDTTTRPISVIPMEAILLKFLSVIIPPLD